MKRLVRLLLCIILLSSCEKEDINSNSSSVCFETTFINSNTQDSFLSVFFLNGRDGFVTGHKGGIYKTIDSAKTWTVLNSTTNLPIHDIYFTDTNNGIAVGGETSCDGTDCTLGGFILKTQNSGQTWKNVFTPSNKGAITSIHFISNLVGFCVGINAIYKTTDGGQNWTESPIANIGGEFTKIEFSDSQNGFLMSYKTILKTTNGGNSWQLVSPSTTGQAIYYALSSVKETVYVAGQGKIVKSSDSGMSWKELETSPADIFAIHFATQNMGYAFGRGNY